MSKHMSLLAFLASLSLVAGCDQLDSLMSSGEGDGEGESETSMETAMTENPPSMTEVQPAMVEPVMVEPAMVEPTAMEEPVMEEPVMEEPVMEEPVMEEVAVMEEPVMEEPGMEEPGMEEPTMGDSSNPLIACRSQADPDQCIIDALAGRTRYAEQMTALIAAYQNKRRMSQAVPLMQDFLRRFPTHNAAERYRQQLLRQGIQPER
jgi:hypothetical protein